MAVIKIGQEEMPDDYVIKIMKDLQEISSAHTEKTGDVGLGNMHYQVSLLCLKISVRLGEELLKALSEPESEK